MRHGFDGVVIFVSMLLGCGAPTKVVDAPEATTRSAPPRQTAPTADIAKSPEAPQATTPPRASKTAIPQVIPNKVTQHTIEYAPGQVAWARPSHRVIFHRLSHASSPETNPAIKALSEGQYMEGAPKKEGVYHQLRFPSTRAVKRHLGEEELPTVEIPRGTRKPYVIAGWSDYRGFYLPRALEKGEPTLHLFELGDASPGRVVAYEVDDLVFAFHPTHSAVIHVPRSHVGVNWLLCQDKHRNHRMIEKSPGCGYQTGQPTIHEAVFWFGRDPSTEANARGYTVPLGVRASYWDTPYIGCGIGACKAFDHNLYPLVFAVDKHLKREAR